MDFRGVVGRTKRIARHIREIGPLSIELKIDGPKGLAQLPAVFAELHKGNPAVEVGIRFFPGASGILRWGYPFRIVWDITDAEPVLPELLPEGAAAMSFCPDEVTIGRLPGVLSEFAEGPVPELHLTNVNAVRSLASKGHVAIPTPDELRSAADGIPPLGRSFEGKRLVVHDYFLWRLLKERFPGAVGARMEFSGCQAATALAYVDWEGNVYPCDSLPVRLGNLVEIPFEEIWKSPVRVSLAASIRSAPSSCAECGAYSGCVAGCRGLAYISSGALDAPDPGCPGPDRGSPTLP